MRKSCFSILEIEFIYASGQSLDLRAVRRVLTEFEFRVRTWRVQRCQAYIVQIGSVPYYKSIVRESECQASRAVILLKCHSILAAAFSRTLYAPHGDERLIWISHVVYHACLQLGIFRTGILESKLIFFQRRIVELWHGYNAGGFQRITRPILYDWRIVFIS